MKTKQKLTQLPVIVCFFGFFLACLVWGLLQPDRAKSETENRPLAQRPAMRRIVTDFSGFARDFDAYAADQFPNREQRIRDYTVLELAQGKKIARKAYCLDGWLFTRLGCTNPEQLDALQTALNTAAETDIPLVYCIVPLKNEVLHDIDPAYFSDETGAENKQALLAMLGGVGHLTAIDASAPLLAGSLAEREQLFYKTDFHWNARGAFAASQEIARQLAAAGLIDAASVPPADAFVWTELGTEKQYQGDLNVWFSDLLPMQEAIPRFVPADTASLSYYDSPGSTEPVPRETLIGSGLDKNPVTYNDVFTYNLGYYRVESPNAPEDKSVLLLKDSFQNASTDYFSSIFRELHVVDPRAYRETPGLSGFLAENDVDLILFFYHQNNVSPELTAFLTQ